MITAWIASLSLSGWLLAQSSSATCESWQDCRREAEAAADRGEFETFHDLAWRVIQLRKATDPELMYLLARAQSLSGRPHDALVMLRRLADMGVASDAATNDDFRRVRALAGWPDLASRLETLAQPLTVGASEGPDGRPNAEPADPGAARDPSSPASSSASTVSAHTGSPNARTDADGSEGGAISPESGRSTTVALSSEVARFPAPPFVPGGLAYDSASRRFVIGNLPDSKLTVVGDGLNRSATLAGAAAGFLGSVGGIEIDRSRGDLWVISGSASGQQNPGETALHKLQLISGRVLGVFPPSRSLGRSRLMDVAVTARGEPLVLDGEGPRLLQLRSEAGALDLAMDLPEGQVTSLAAGPGRVVFVSYTDRLVRADLADRRVRTLAASASKEPIAGLERIRWHRGSLVAVQAAPEGRRIVQVRLSRDQTHAVEVVPLESDLPGNGQPVDLATFGDDLYYLLAPGGGGDAVVRRIPLP